ncbi:translocation/assembly module TamB domain-containing protein [Ruficoccus amylovorans]|uniref:Translocation/assembly module TamB domain-containing protein n=1 Tax=Ruficoccus amylovorans TaxID=1804625 RepID=A0A842HBN4_9BACT|nr:translocation/assembly module TamB domain-containing protein [Ruficoccus amylovorans]MBC2593680.1 translocation/assembly module TamB domain-containing protein [Ruficoccus amylovorans]
MRRLPFRKTRKVLLRLVLVFVLLAVVAFASSPWWLGWALGMALKGTGAGFDRYERVGYSTFRLSEIRYADPQAGLEADISTLQTATPPALLWKKLTGEPTEITLGTIEVRQTEAQPAAQPAPPPPAADEEIQPAALARQAFDALELLDGWPVAITVEKVLYTSGDLSVTADSPQYTEGTFSTVLGTSLSEQRAELTFSRESAQARTLKLAFSPEPTTVEIGIALPAPSELALTGQIDWREQPGTFGASWRGSGLLPAEATFSARDWTLPEEILAREDRQGYAAPQASAQADWNGQRYTLSLDATARPEQDGLPPLTARIEAAGDLEAVSLDKIAVEGGWITARLAEPVTVPFSGLSDLPPARFELEADLSKQNFFPIRGKLDASLVADDQTDSAYPLVTARLDARDLAYEDYTADTVEVEAVLDWPQLTLGSCAVTLPEDSSLSLSGSYDLEQEHLSAIKASLVISGALVSHYAPEAPAFSALKADFTADGPLARPRHEGDFTLEQFEWAEDRVDISLHWRGEHGALEVLSGKGGGEALDFNWEGNADLSPDSQRITVSEASLRPRNFSELRLTQPVTLTHLASGEITLTELSIADTEGSSVQAQANVNWPESGQLDLAVSNIGPHWLKLLTDAKLPFPAHLSQVQAGVRWDNSPLTYTLTATATGEPENQQPVTLSLDVAGDADGARMNHLTAQQGETVLAEARGHFPVAVVPAAETLVQFRAEAPADFHLAVSPGQSSIWDWLQKEYQLVLDEPSLTLDVEGTLASPTGKLSAHLKQFDIPEGSELPDIPDVDNLHVEAMFAPEEITVNQLGLDLAGHPLTANGRLPMTEEAWLALIEEGREPDLTGATGSLRFESVPLSAFAEFLPDILRPSGTINLRAELKPGLDWSGELSVQGVETLPLPQIGSVSEIQAQLAIAGPRLEITRASALLGGQELAITGEIGIESPENPRFDLAIKGEQIPFVRSPGLIVRGSPDLTLLTDADGVTTLGGKVVLNESFYTIDLTALGQGGGGGAAAAPDKRFPYFSIDDEPMADWRLRIEVEGDGFLRVRIPVFEGILSADLNMLGTLREPQAIGQVTIDQGIVMFPFANLRIAEGSNITIRQDQPYDPVIDITANGRAYGYDLVMRLTGRPDDPQLTFSSTPALEQGDILLMITAGRMPESDQRSTQSRLTGLGVFVGNTILVDMGLIDPLDDQLQVFVGEDVTLTGKDTIRVLYRIDDTWSIVGQYDRFDAYTLDLKWTVYED